jgi:myosin heavy subunit
MKAIVHAVAIVVLLGAAYFTLEHHRKFGELEEVRLKTISDNKRISANAEATETELKKTKEALAAAQQKREELSQGLASLQSTSNTLQREAGDLDTTLKTQDDEFAELNKAREEVAAIVKNLGEDITLENLGEKIKEVDEDLKAKKIKVEELETLAESASKALATTRAEIDRLIKREIDRNTRIGRNAMEAVVTAVNQDWGFLVIGAGSNSGFTPQTSLLVQRDGRLVGRVTPSAIEPTQTIAEIDFKSIGTGVRLQPGDRVILTKPTSN